MVNKLKLGVFMKTKPQKTVSSKKKNPSAFQDNNFLLEQDEDYDLDYGALVSYSQPRNGTEDSPGRSTYY